MTGFSKGLHVLILVVSSFIFISTAQAKSIDSDPCDNISVNWTGSWLESITGISCSFDATAQGAKYKDHVHLQVTLSNGKERYGAPDGFSCDDFSSSFVISGVCRDGVITLRYNNLYLEGTIFGEILEFQGNSIAVQLRK